MEDRLEIAEIAVEKIMEQIRESVRKHQQEFSPSAAVSTPPTDQVAVDLTTLHRDYDIYPLHFASHRRVWGRFVVLAKKTLQKLLTPILARQLAYNAANTRVTSALWEQVAALRQQQADALQTLRMEVGAQVAGLQQQQADALQTLRMEVGAQVAGLQQQQADALQTLRMEVGAQVAGLQQQQADALQALRVEAEQGFVKAEQGFAGRDAQMVVWERAVERLKTEIVLQERRITILLEEARKRLPDPWSQEQVQSVADEADHVLDALYVSFEDQFRGTGELIKERLRS